MQTHANIEIDAYETPQCGRIKRATKAKSESVSFSLTLTRMHKRSLIVQTLAVWESLSMRHRAVCVIKVDTPPEKIITTRSRVCEAEQGRTERDKYTAVSEKGISGGCS